MLSKSNLENIKQTLSTDLLKLESNSTRLLLKKVKAEMTKIQLEFECTAPEGICVYSLAPNICITYIGEKSMWVCDCLMATRKKEKASQKGSQKYCSLMAPGGEPLG
jgi:hypothetical protein